MTKSKKIVLAITIPTAIILIAMLCLIGIYAVPICIDAYQHRNWTAIDYCEDRWDISLPENATIEYNFSNRGGFFGDGIEYTVCRLSSSPDDFLKDFELNKPKCVEKYNSISTHLLNDTNIDANKLFAPDENIVWKSQSKSYDILLLAYDTQNNLLYIIESL